MSVPFLCCLQCQGDAGDTFVASPSIVLSRTTVAKLSENDISGEIYDSAISI